MLFVQYIMFKVIFIEVYAEKSAAFYSFYLSVESIKSSNDSSWIIRSLL